MIRQNILLPFMLLLETISKLLTLNYHMKGCRSQEKPCVVLGLTLLIGDKSNALNKIIHYKKNSLFLGIKCPRMLLKISGSILTIFFCFTRNSNW